MKLSQKLKNLNEKIDNDSQNVPDMQSINRQYSPTF